MKPEDLFGEIIHQVANFATQYSSPYKAKELNEAREDWVCQMNESCNMFGKIINCDLSETASNILREIENSDLKDMIYENMLKSEKEREEFSQKPNIRILNLFAKTFLQDIELGIKKRKDENNETRRQAFETIHNTYQNLLNANRSRSSDSEDKPKE